MSVLVTLLFFDGSFFHTTTIPISTYSIHEASSRTPLQVKHRSVRVQDTKREVRLGVALKLSLVIDIAVHTPDLNHVGICILFAKWVELVACNTIFGSIWESSDGDIVHIILG